MRATGSAEGAWPFEFPAVGGGGFEKSMRDNVAMTSFDGELERDSGDFFGRPLSLSGSFSQISWLNISP